MKFVIKCLISMQNVFECEADTWSAAIKKAMENSADLGGADLRGAYLSGANFSQADLGGANFSRANLSGANFSRANLSGANLSRANLRYADLSGANLSQSKGLSTAAEYLSQFEKDSLGIIVFRAQFGQFSPPVGWKFISGNFLVETPDSCRAVECGCGVAFATLEWLKKTHLSDIIWKCRIRYEDLADVVVPYNTDGKARCARLELLETIKFWKL